MGLSVSIVLFLILYVGISAVAGLEVSYFAFSKEMGNQAQKGKQQ
jgi:flagellar basal body-associated protein FliL